MDRIATGIDTLDQITSGGLPAGRSYLIAGEPGTGKTIFSLQFLLEGVRVGETCLYITIDEKPEQIIANAQQLGWDLTPYLKSGSLAFLDVTAYFGSWESTIEQVNFNRVIANIIGYVEKKGVDRLVIDPISPLIFANKVNSTITYFIRSLMFQLDELSCTALLTSPIPVGSNQFSRHGVEEFLSSGIILLKLTKVDYHYHRRLEIKKLRGTSCELSEYSFNISSKKGITLRPSI